MFNWFKKKEVKDNKKNSPVMNPPAYSEAKANFEKLKNEKLNTYITRINGDIKWEIESGKFRIFVAKIRLSETSRKMDQNSCGVFFDTFMDREDIKILKQALSAFQKRGFKLNITKKQGYLTSYNGPTSLIAEIYLTWES